MEKFSENFRGGLDHILCPLCGVHLDNQEMSFKCQVLKSNIKIEGDMDDLYEDEINIKVAETIKRISEFRKENI